MEFVTFSEDIVPPPPPQPTLPLIFLGSKSIATVKSIESDFFLSARREEAQVTKPLEVLSVSWAREEVLYSSPMGVSVGLWRP